MIRNNGSSPALSTPGKSRHFSALVGCTPDRLRDGRRLLDSSVIAFPYGKPPKSAVADLGKVECRSRVNPRSVSTFPGNALCLMIRLKTAAAGSFRMNVMTPTRLEVVPLAKHIGAEIRGIDLRQKPDPDTVKAIYQAWLDHI